MSCRHHSISMLRWPSACVSDAHDFASQITYSATRQVGDGPKPSRKRPPFGGLRVKKSHLERETGLEPANPLLGKQMLRGEMLLGFGVCAL